MKRITLVILMAAAFSSAYGGPLQQKRLADQSQRGRPNAVLRRPVIADAVLGYYVKQFQQMPEVTPELFAKIVPYIEQFITVRLEISQRRTRALNQLRQATRANAVEDELKRLIRQLDAADAEYQANQERFFSSVDPLLNVRQQARMRILQNLADNRLREMLSDVQNLDAQRPNQARD